ncbi:MAG: lipase [Clostridia bacterium]|nr:lipase [Clostridia bacterium]
MNRKRSLTTVLIFIILIAAVALCFSSCGGSEDQKESEPASTLRFDSIDDGTSSVPDQTTAEPETTQIPDTIETETEPVPDTTVIPEFPEDHVPTVPEDGAFNGCLFIGDSRTMGIDMYGALPGADVFATIGMSVYHVMTDVVTVDGIGDVTLTQLLASKEYSKIYILLGINEIGYDFDYTARKFGELLDLLKENAPDSKIIIEANLHVTATRSANDDTFTNYNINAYNEKLRQFVDNVKVFYLDANQLFDDENGCLNEAYSSDGIHLQVEYYIMWGEWLASINAQN